MSARLQQCRSGSREELPDARGQGQRQRGTTPPRRSGAPPERSYPTSKEQLLRGRRRAERSYSTFKVRRGGREEIPFIQGKQRRLPLCWSSREEIPHVRGKRNPSKTVGVARGHQRADTLKPSSQKTSQSDPRTTALSNSVRLSHAVWGHPGRSGHGGEG